ncbi:hypothetical protein [Marinoscillum furvescens]|uniref:Uncharacterized protein n=1 Tax=Marinoscillum furvescens DSM 4134 TaxID=1122208 RepID=A0A3D9L3D8_MARFU|nr:hypothetical protein [Marinoscillum furvescens]RED98912.1 hypothetical protein C7460_109104 [Marinoscillum furvescens DSM 4134]
MEGINFLTNENNERVAVQINLDTHGKLWEDFYDCLIAENRKNDDRLPFDEVVSDLKKSGKLDESL